MAALTAREFAEAYAARSDMTVEGLVALGQVVVRCECEYEGCRGWAMVSREIVESVRRSGVGAFLGGTDYSRICWPEDEGEEVAK